MNKPFKAIILGILALLLMGGGYGLLVYFNLVKGPAVLLDLPVVGSKLGQDSPARTLSDPLIEENQKLKDRIASREKQITKLEKKSADFEKQWKRSEIERENLQEEMAGLNDQIQELKASPTGKQMTYQDMARYYAEMKTQDAADILTRLSDEDIIGILTAMESDQAAEILQKMNHDRAAAITKKMLNVSS
ncbi:MotE family protein [Syntrophomonas erecta]